MVLKNNWKRIGKKSIGFGSDISDNVVKDKELLLKQVQSMICWNMVWYLSL